MNATSDFDRRASAWLADGPTELSDRVLDAALREVHVTRQRRGLATLLRFPRADRFLGMQAAALVAVVLIAGAVVLIAPRLGIGGPSPMPDRTPSPAPSTTVPPSPTTVPPSPSPGPTPRVPGSTIASDGLRLTAGVRYVLPDFEPAFSFTGSNILFGIDGQAFAWFEHVASPATGLGVIQPRTAFAEGGATEPVPADIVGWFQERGDLVISSVTAVTLGSVEGTLLEGTVPGDAFSNAGGAINVLCPNATGCNYESGGSIGYEPGHHVLILVTIVAGTPVTAMATAPEAAWPDIGADLDAFLRSFRFQD